MMPAYTVAQVRDIILLASALGFDDDVKYWQAALDRMLEEQKVTACI